MLTFVNLTYFAGEKCYVANIYHLLSQTLDINSRVSEFCDAKTTADTSLVFEESKEKTGNFG